MAGRGRSTVLAMSVASPQPQQIRGMEVSTSIVREASETPVYFGAQGPVGNATAVHTEAVLATPAEHYDHWATVFGAERSGWRWCHWGENLTLTGLDENLLRIGDILHVGPEAVFQVTSPRIPCFKLAWRLGQADAVLPQMIQSGKVGFYLSVLSPGLVTRLDPVRRVSAGAAITVGDLSRLLIDRTLSSSDPLKRVVDEPSLGAQARGMLLKRITALDDAERLKTRRWSGWRAFALSQAGPETGDVASFDLSPLDGDGLAPPLAGQFLALRLGDEADAPVRTWTLSDYADAPKRYRLSVKRARDGLGSHRIREIASAGGRVWARSPAGRFVMRRDGFMRIALISAGIGVTPMAAMLKAHLQRKDQPPLLWIHQARDGASHALGGEVDGLLREAGAMRRIFYSQPTSNDRRGEQYDEAGRLDADGLRALIAPPYLANPFGREIELPGAYTDVYVCGPPAFEAMVRQALMDLGVNPAQIQSESFAPTSSLAAPAIETARVRFEPGGTEARWDAARNVTILELAEACGLRPAFGCRNGSCGSCEGALLCGDVVYDPAPAVVVARGRLLPCCARPASPKVEVRLQPIADASPPD